MRKKLSILPVYAAGKCDYVGLVWCLEVEWHDFAMYVKDYVYSTYPIPNPNSSVCIRSGLYLHPKKMAELEAAKSLSTLNLPYAGSGREPVMYLALKLTFARSESTDSIVDEFYKELAGSKGDYKRSLDAFKDILARQMNASTNSGAGTGGMQKGEEMEFLFQGTKILGMFPIL